jgi:hypothetical protein
MRHKPRRSKPALTTRYGFAKKLKFERLHREWLAARAAYYADPDRPEEVQDELWAAQDAAELAVIVQPPPATWAVWIKWEILDCLATEEAQERHLIENRIITALGAITADILRFGLRNGN